MAKRQGLFDRWSHIMCFSLLISEKSGFKQVCCWGAGQTLQMFGNNKSPSCGSTFAIFNHGAIQKRSSGSPSTTTLHGRHGVSNYRQLDYSCNSLFKLTTKYTVAFKPSGDWIPSHDPIVLEAIPCHDVMNGCPQSTSYRRRAWGIMPSYHGQNMQKSYD